MLKKKDWLTLGLVDCHCKSYFHWELKPRPLERILSFLWDQTNPWNEDSPLRSRKDAFKDLAINCPDEDQFCPIAESLFQRVIFKVFVIANESRRGKVK